jgi:translation initiation factor 3 subunit I
VVVGGGQDAAHVTTTDHRAGKFEAKFYDKVNFIFLSNTILRSLRLLFFIFVFCFCLDSSRRNWGCERTFWTDQRTDL